MTEVSRGQGCLLVFGVGALGGASGPWQRRPASLGRKEGTLVQVASAFSWKGERRGVVAGLVAWHASHRLMVVTARA